MVVYEFFIQGVAWGTPCSYNYIGVVTLPMKLPRFLRPSAGGHDCVELRKRASDYLEAAVSDEEKEHILGQLELCGNCRRFVETLRTTIGMLGHLSPHAVPEDLKDRLLRVPKEKPHG